ncbi:RNA binding protein [Zostera marina]|uniref:RNA binding protein n=1 Tax=Zostera marina TaxID=29655 RepID=A0A0K9Q678_ZOSMR|nr:RNA binding protein [Zostera marina]
MSIFFSSATSCSSTPAPTSVNIYKPILPCRTTSSIHFIYSFSSSASISLYHSRRIWTKSKLSVVSDEQQLDSIDTTEKQQNSKEEEEKVQKGYELYVCNLPRSTEISDLVDLFKPFGTLISVEVTRNADTGVSRGCGYVTLTSAEEAEAAIVALDGSDLGSRELRVKFSEDMISGRKNNTMVQPKKIIETPYKTYAGNLSWSVTVEDLKEYFSQYGTVVTARLLHDKKSGKNRAYGFISFSSADEAKAATASNGMVFKGRTMPVREVLKE